ncbi:MAG: nucleoside transporter C-terminal domain-containing protein [Bacteroidota bacterium]
MSFLQDLLRAGFGMVFLLGICYLLSRDRKAIDWRLVGIGVLSQVVIAILMLKAPFVKTGVDAIATGFRKTLEFTAAGSEFLFSNLVDPSKFDTFGYIFAFQVLPTIVFFSALTAILYYLGILQKVVYGMAWLLSKTLGLSGPESLAAAANVFIGQTEAPLVVKPYLEKMTKSELLCLMVGGMATIAGSVYVAYIGMLGDSIPIPAGLDPEAAGLLRDEARQFFAVHLLTASMISAPAAIVCAKMLYPESKTELAAKTGHPEAIGDGHTLSEDELSSPTKDKRLEMAADDSDNLLDAISKGTTDGLKLAVNVGAMLLVFTALVFMLNTFFLEGTNILNWMVNGFDQESWTALTESNQTWNQQISTATGGRFEGFSFTYFLALIFAPIAWIIGVEAKDITLVGQLLGLKTVVNEFVAYAEFQDIRNAASGAILSPKSTLIVAYALCGFANFASIGIQIGGISAIAPAQRTNLTRLGIMALIGGTIACLMTGTIAGLFYGT